MRVGVVVYSVDSQSGGGYTFYSEVISALKQAKSQHDFVFISLSSKDSKNENIITLRYGNKLIRVMKRIYAKLKQGLNLRYTPVFIETESTQALNFLVRQHKIDLLYYPIPSYIKSNCPSVITLWDLAHRVYPFFPEVSFEGWTWGERENFYNDTLPRAAAVITGTETGKKQAIRYYNLTQENVFVNPFFAAQFSQSAEKRSETYNQNTKLTKFIFYPAQFWSHKNHANLLHALNIVRKKTLEIRLVLCGSDKGNLDYIKRVVKELNLENFVDIRGFIPVEELVQLYKNAEMVVFPSYFGPDNLPPLEAMALGCPVATADIEGARDQLEDAAIYFKPESPESIATAILDILDNFNLRQQLITKGQALTKSRTPEIYVDNLLKIFDKLEPYRRCWPNSSIP